MAFIPTIETAQRRINQSRLLYQDALAGVAEGRAILQAEVDAGRLVPGTQEFLNARNRLVNSAQSYADTVKLQYEEDLAQLDAARQYAQAEQGPNINTQASTTLAPNQSPGAPQPQQIVDAGQITGTPPAEINPAQNPQTPAPAQEFTQSSTGLNVLPEDVDAAVDGPTQEGVTRFNDGANLGVPDEFGFVTDPVTGLNVLPEDLPVEDAAGYVTEFTPEGPRVLSTEEVQRATDESAARDRARQQQVISAQRRQINNGDWRVRLRLAPGAKYLYKDPSPGILQPLAITDGVIFPYTPTISTAYKANYSNYDLTHSNYRGYFYQNSYVDPIQITATFTAQNTAEANYLLAVIQFFRSVTKMFYGQDAQRGSPPPLTYLTGLGEFQFNEHPCVVSQFNYTLPADIDYIRAGSPNQLGTNQVNQRDRQTVSTGSAFGGLNRLAAALLTKGAIPNPPAPPSFGQNRPTYVPTKMEMVISLLPIQSRDQISKQFSVKEFANGNLIKGGFW
jgi:hypothetical protein